jgi:hypothetical protein
LSEDRLRFLGPVANHGKRRELLNGEVANGDLAAQSFGQGAQLVQELLPREDLSLFGRDGARGIHDTLPRGPVSGRERMHERFFGRLEPLDRFG